MKKVDISLLILFPILALIITIFCKTNLLESTLLFFGVPSLYLIIRDPNILKKSFIFSFIFFLAMCPFLDALGTLDKAWSIPTIFHFKFFGISTVENYIFGFFWILIATLFYEHFFEKGKWKEKISKNIRYLIAIAIFLISVLTVFFFYNLQLLTITYFYLWASLIFVLPPLILFLYLHPKFLRNFLLLSIYFFFLLFLFEIGALHNAQWAFPGRHFIGFVEIFNYKFPIEEFVFWMILCTPSLICYYEFFADGVK
jgi:hypothetical protein